MSETKSQTKGEAMTTAYKVQNAKDTYANAKRELDCELARLTQAIADHTGNPDWGHVGSINHVCQLVEQAADFLTGEAS